MASHSLVRYGQSTFHEYFYFPRDGMPQHRLDTHLQSGENMEKPDAHRHILAEKIRQPDHGEIEQEFQPGTAGKKGQVGVQLHFRHHREIVV